MEGEENGTLYLRKSSKIKCIKMTQENRLLCTVIKNFKLKSRFAAVINVYQATWSHLYHIYPKQSQSCPERNPSSSVCLPQTQAQSKTTRPGLNSKVLLPRIHGGLPVTTGQILQDAGPLPNHLYNIFLS